MQGALTQLISTPHFGRRERGRWCIIQPFAKYESFVKGLLDDLGIENYVPMLTVYDGRGSRKGKEPVLKEYIFACWDPRQAPGLCKPKHKIHYCEVPNIGEESNILATMEGYWRAEVISERFPVLLGLGAPEGEPFAPPRGLLAGCQGFLSTVDGRPVFALPMGDSTQHIEVRLPAADFRSPASRKPASVSCVLETEFSTPARGVAACLSHQ